MIAHGWGIYGLVSNLMIACGLMKVSEGGNIDDVNNETEKGGALRGISLLQAFFESNESTIWKPYTFANCPLSRTS